MISYTDKYKFLNIYVSMSFSLVIKMIMLDIKFMTRCIVYIYILYIYKP